MIRVFRFDRSPASVRSRINDPPLDVSYAYLVSGRRRTESGVQGKLRNRHGRFAS
ncbi:predicted protein [Plenodomus lingam JN3]|uniref:Predicted protein n=1 Tax=Leptosphaeria maculans (strain JN3 / isolate v23.1.3 / race Av1-4-5-6-7-8) TaxID=985895 RepID=E4ZT35_LEPMJ|nr:predicted protein [Plenodomus lingam JN3]CBX94466.1 predicted protein [Plenodomus lingam JN3]